MRVRRAVIGGIVAAAATGGVVAATMPSAQASPKSRVSTCTSYGPAAFSCTLVISRRHVRADVKYFEGCPREKQIYSQLQAASSYNRGYSFNSLADTQRQQAKTVYHLANSHHCFS